MSASRRRPGPAAEFFVFLLFAILGPIVAVALFVGLIVAGRALNDAGHARAALSQPTDKAGRA